MSNSLILYVGERAAGQELAALAEQQGSYVYLPDNMMQALGMYITYFPQIVVIDMSVDYAQDVFDHLRSVDAKPLILLTNAYIRSASVFTLPPDIPAEVLLEMLDRLDEPQRVPNGLLHYA